MLAYFNFGLYWIEASLVAQMVKNLPAVQTPGFDPWVGKIPWRREELPTPVFLPEESHGLRSLAGCSPWVAKSQTRLSTNTFTFHPGHTIRALQFYKIGIFCTRVFTRTLHNGIKF